MDHRTFEQFVRKAVEGIPSELRAALDNIDIVIEDRPTRQQLEDLEMEPGEPLFGLYEGTPLPERGIDSYPMPDKITIFRGELLRAGFRGRELIEEIRLTVVHEIGHYFGFDDDHLEDIGY